MSAKSVRCTQGQGTCDHPVCCVLRENEEKGRQLGAKTEAERLIAEGYYQISNKYRLLAKLPEGKTGIQALEEASLEEYRKTRPSDIKPEIDAYWLSHYPTWARGLGEYHAGAHYLTTYAAPITVSEEVWAEFYRLCKLTRRSRTYDGKAKEKLLKVQWFKREKDLLFMWENTPSPNSALLHSLFMHAKYEGKTFVEHLKERGFDITTLKFEIRGPAK